MVGSVYHGVRSSGLEDGVLCLGLKRKSSFAPKVISHMAVKVGGGSGIQRIEPHCSWRRHAAHDVLLRQSMQRACLWLHPPLAAWKIRITGFC